MFALFISFVSICCCFCRFLAWSKLWYSWLWRNRMIPAVVFLCVLGFYVLDITPMFQFVLFFLSIVLYCISISVCLDDSNKWTDAVTLQSTCQQPEPHLSNYCVNQINTELVISSTKWIFLYKTLCEQLIHCCPHTITDFLPIQLKHQIIVKYQHKNLQYARPG